MNLRELPCNLDDDPYDLAAVMGMLPVRSGQSIILMSKEYVLALLEAPPKGRNDISPEDLRASLHFDADLVFDRNYTQIASKTMQLRTTTSFLILQEMSRTKEGINQIMQRLLSPYVYRAFESLNVDVDSRKRDMLTRSFDEWDSHKDPMDEFHGELDICTSKGQERRPTIHIEVPEEDIPIDLKDYIRYFLKDLFRLNNVYDGDNFRYRPEVLEDYWEVVAVEQARFSAHIIPSEKSIALTIFSNENQFGIQRSDDPDYLDLVEFLIREERLPAIKNCKIKLNGRTTNDEEILEEMLSIETDLYDDQMHIPYAIGIPHQLSEEGLLALRKGLHRLSGLSVDLMFPVSSRPEMQYDDLTTLGFDLDVSLDGMRFIFDGRELSEAGLDDIASVIGEKLLALSRTIYSDPPNFPSPDIGPISEELHDLIGYAEKEGVTDELVRQIISRIVVLDYYRSLTKLSYALSEQTIKRLNGMHDITFTMPKILMPFLDMAMRGEDIDRMVICGLKIEEERP